MSYFERMIAVVGNLDFTGARMSGRPRGVIPSRS
jgi:hypothetical protein